ncbi:MAG: hypothetical protein COB26_06040 [Piscirickettsiaceae bacterium]|nr:MAG: hypothetical protein COB26_06040 [Piscirickettsiaceae bacterium]
MKIKPIVWMLLLTVSSQIHAEKTLVGNFSGGQLLGWQEKEFAGKTTYRLTQDNKHLVLSSFSNNSASGLFKNVNINLNKTPIIHWSWKVKHSLNINNERIKSGDDFAARIYIVFSDGPFFWQTKTLNYIWANQSKIGDNWPNPYTSNAQMLAIQSGNGQANQWQEESRNVLHDIQLVFGKPITNIKAIAIMTDTDQTGLDAQAWFGDIWFSDH